MTNNLDFDVILTETQSRVRAYIAGMGGALDTVDDIAQEVYLAFHANLDKCRMAWSRFAG